MPTVICKSSSVITKSDSLGCCNPFCYCRQNFVCYWSWIEWSKWRNDCLMSDCGYSWSKSIMPMSQLWSSRDGSETLCWWVSPREAHYMWRTELQCWYLPSKYLLSTSSLATRVPMDSNNQHEQRKRKSLGSASYTSRFRHWSFMGKLLWISRKEGKKQDLIQPLAWSFKKL